MQQKPVFTSGTVKVYIADNETAMGEFTADYITAVLKEQYKQHKIPVLWLMAAPSGFAFYRALIQHAQKDQPLRNILRETHFFQFDDYQ